MSDLEYRPMKPEELGKYVCVAHGGCLHSPAITITADGVWVRSPDPDPLNPGSHLYSSAHRDCFEAWQARERLEELRAALRAESISYGELAELQALAPLHRSRRYRAARGRRDTRTGDTRRETQPDH